MKIPRPDGEIEKLGLSILDEPKLNQSKRAVLDLMLAEHGKVHRKDYKEVHSIDNAHKNPREIQNWVNNVEKIISNRHAATVQYSSKMPDIDSLMQVKDNSIKSYKAWDPAFEDAISEIQIPDGEIDIPIEDFAKYACAILDIPVHKKDKETNLIESMHVLFTLYNGFKANQHFQENDYHGGDVHTLKVN